LISRRGRSSGRGLQLESRGPEHAGLGIIVDADAHLIAPRVLIHEGDRPGGRASMGLDPMLGDDHTIANAQAIPVELRHDFVSSGAHFA
jgi:hypothetical protein